MIKKQEGVWIADPGIVRWHAADVEFLEHEAPRTHKKRARICFHQGPERVHEMLIAFCAGSDNPMHCHDRMESVFVLKGKLRVEFEDRTEFLGAGDYLRVPAGVQHRPVPVTDCVILETAEK